MSLAPHILVAGANGQLGQELKQIAANYPSFTFIFFTKDDLPIHQLAKVEQVFKHYQPAYFINCAAYTAVDKAEEDSENAFEINGYATGVLAAACKKNNTRFIHISTDYVFDGRATIPYKEDDGINPQGVYGKSKAEGERLALACNPDSIIIRTAWVYSAFGKNFVKTMLKLMQERESINVVADQIGSPTYAADLAAAMMHIIISGKWVPGIYHYSNDGIISWFDFAVAIKNEASLNCIISPIPSSAYPTPAKRPSYSVLDKSKITRTFGLPILPWQLSLQTCLTKLL
jgi:dTDP-4-dehydrorhamnose reductase